jgi:excisionase family DNA binding protein
VRAYIIGSRHCRISKTPQTFDFAPAAAYNAAGPIQVRPVLIGFLEFGEEIGTLFPIKPLSLPDRTLTVLRLQKRNAVGFPNPIPFLENVRLMGSHDRRDSPRDSNVAPMNVETEEPLAVSVEEAARRLSVSPATIGHMIDDKRLTASRIIGRAGKRGRVVVHVEALAKLLIETRVK